MVDPANTATAGPRPARERSSSMTAISAPTAAPIGSVTLATVLALLGLGSDPAEASGWRWSVTPYAWATDVGVGATLRGRTVIDEEISVDDLMEDVETLFQVRIEGQRGPFGVSLDVFDVTLADAVSDVALPNGAGSADFDADMGMTIIDVAGFLDPKGDGVGASFLYGARILNERAAVDATFSTGASIGDAARRYETNDTFIDVLAGFRYTRRFGSHVSLRMQADITTGGTEYTWSAGPTLSYAFGESGRHALLAGYRRMDIRFKDEGELSSNLTLSGPLLGFRASF
jgi:hypothetical protein